MMEPVIIVPREIRSSTYISPRRLPLLPLASYGVRNRKLGEGGYGDVYLYKKGDQEVAVKESSKEFGAADLREVSILVMLDHQNVIDILDFIPDFNHPAMIMPLAQGSLRGQRFSEDEKIKLSYDICLGVAYCHMRGILHRDIKPDNILVFRGPTAKIADFGLARAMGCSQGMNQTAMLYTIFYRPPEVFLGAEYTYSADVWAVGCTLYEFFTGERVNQADDSDNEKKLLTNIMYRFGAFDPVSWPEMLSFPGYKPWISKDPRKYKPLKHIPNMEMDKLIHDMLQINPRTRITMLQATQRDVFNRVRKPEDDLPVTSCINALNMKASYPIEDPTLRTTVINHGTRHILYEWLQDVMDMWSMGIRTLLLAMEYLDRSLLQFPKTKKDKFQLLGCACYYIASMYTEVIGLLVEDMVWVADGAFTGEELLITVSNVLRALRYDLCTSTTYDYLVLYRDDYSDTVTKCAEGLLLLIPETSLQRTHLAHSITLACIKISCIVYREKFKHEERCKANVDSAIPRILDECETRAYTKYVEKRTRMKANELVKRFIP